MGNIKIGVMAGSMPIHGEEGFKLASELGLQTMEIDISANFETGNLSTKEKRAELKAMATKYGIEFTSLGVNAFCKYASHNPDNAEVVDKFTTYAVEVADEMGIKILQVPSFGASEIKSDEDFNNTITFYKGFCDKAKPYGIMVGSESPLSAEENLTLIKSVDKDNFKIYFDTQNPSVCHGYNSAEIFMTLKDYIVECHAKDGMNVMSNAILGEGNSNFFETAKAIVESGFTGAIQLENNYNSITNKGSDEEKIEAFKKDVAIMKECFCK